MKLKIKTIVVLIIVSAIAIIATIALPFVNIKNSVFPKNLGQSQKTYQENNEITISMHSQINIIIQQLHRINNFTKR